MTRMEIAYMPIGRGKQFISLIVDRERQKTPYWDQTHGDELIFELWQKDEIGIRTFLSDLEKEGLVEKLTPIMPGRVKRFFVRDVVIVGSMIDGDRMILGDEHHHVYVGEKASIKRLLEYCEKTNIPVSHRHSTHRMTELLYAGSNIS